MRRFLVNRVAPVAPFAGRLLLALALVLGNGAWADLLASAFEPGCGHDSAAAMAHSDHDGGGTGMNCCGDADAGGCPHGADACGLACTASCGHGGQPGVTGSQAPQILAVRRPPALESGHGLPAPNLTPALRPPISA